MGEHKYKALLIGAANYEAPGISSLPFVPGDLERLGEALVARGFHEARVAQASWFTTNVVNGEVARFLKAAGKDDRLLVVLSGHGVHHDGRDYLVPEDIRPELHTFAEGCVALDWRREIEDSAAAQVVFLIDACREGIRQDTKATAAWSRQKAAAALRRKVAYVYACSQAEYARFVRDTDSVREGHDAGIEPGASFSLFSRALSDRIGAVTDLAELRREVQERVDALHTAYGKSGRPQQLRVLSEEPDDGFVVFPPREPAPARELPSGPERVWAEAVTTHLAWTYAEADTPARAAAVAELKDACGALAARFARDARIPTPRIEDPWFDAELAERTTDRLGFLLQRLAPGTVLSPTEVALLAVLPFAAQAHRARQIAARGGRPTAELAAFLERFPRLGRRLRALHDSAQFASVRDIHWWGYHRWLAQQPDAFAAGAGADDIPACSPWVRDELGADRLLRHLKEQRIAPAAAPGVARGTELFEEREVAPSTAQEHTVRERLVSGLFKAAHALAVDPADLPEVLVEHLGISDSVSLPDLLTTVRQSTWAASGPGRSLTALCGHPAVELALKRHAESVDTLLRALHDAAARKGSSLAPLSGLPAYADARRVRPSGAAPANLSAGIRFRLADDRVQELLMGEQLYGDRGLAIRELYQNALDACRYREARTEYLRRTGHDPAPGWEGEIAFTEGVDDSGRPYVECADNGIGMGVTELQRAFAQGGSRFVDLPEYAEERVEWAALEPPVELVPVSRFGIGVLSYFMLADELTLWTCRLGRDGRPGRLLKVTVAGPGALFRVEDLGPGEEAGTRVRLRGVAGRELPSSGDVLERRLWLAPYRVRAVSAQKTRTWEPGVLRTAEARTWEPVQEGKFGSYTWSSGFSSDSVRFFHTGQPRLAHETPDPDVWWTDGEGAVLVDGMLIDRGLFGRVVDLHGDQEVTLSVDRAKILGHDTELVHHRCAAVVEDLVERPDVLTPAWLARLHAQDPELGVQILESAVRRNAKWRHLDRQLDVTRTGLFLPDSLLLPVVIGRFPDASPHDALASLLILCMPEPVLRWRLRALLDVGPADSELTAMPGDTKLLALIGPGQWNEAVEELARRFSNEAGGYRGWNHIPHPREVEALRSLFPWRPTHRAVTPTETLDAAYRAGIPVADAAGRLRAIGYTVDIEGPLKEVTPDEFPLLHLGKRLPHDAPTAWLQPGDWVPLIHLLDQPHPARAAERLAGLGCRIPATATPLPASRVDLSPDTIALLDELRRATPRIRCAPSSEHEACMVETYDIGFLSEQFDRPPEDARDQLLRMGFRVGDHGADETAGRVPRMQHYSPKQRVTNAELRPLAVNAPDLVTPVTLRVAAEIAGVAEHTLRTSLEAHGIPAPAEDGPAHDRTLVQHLKPSDGSPKRPLPEPGTRIKLAELASASLAVHLPFREVADRARELGFSHEAEDWWADA